MNVIKASESFKDHPGITRGLSSAFKFRLSLGSYLSKFVHIPLTLPNFSILGIFIAFPMRCEPEGVVEAVWVTVGSFLSMGFNVYCGHIVVKKHFFLILRKLPTSGLRVFVPKC